MVVSSSKRIEIKRSRKAAAIAGTTYEQGTSRGPGDSRSESPLENNIPTSGGVDVKTKYATVELVKNTNVGVILKK